jgi:hypothetical protein
MCTNSEGLYQYGAERHHDHEVEDVAELDAGQGQQQIFFALRSKGV